MLALFTLPAFYKNIKETTVLNLVFKGFLKHQLHHWFIYFMHSQFSVGNFPTHSTEKLRRGALLSFRKVLVSKKFMDKREGRGEAARFSVECFLSHRTKNFVGEPFLVSEKYWFRDFSCIRERGGGVSRFSVVIIRWKNVSKGWDSNPYLLLQNPVVLPTVPWETFEFLTNVS